jgi:thiamine-monophosphate kinase
VHFLASDVAGDVARKALRVNLSDLAAKGARPLAYMMILALRPETDDAWVAAFADALAADQAHFGLALIGGDSVSTPGPPMISITAFGSVEAGRMVKRSGARAGDRLFVSGTIGDAALGLKLLKGEIAAADPVDEAALTARYRVPEPRGALAAVLAGYASAAIDISDGLAADAGHLCRTSGVIGIIEAARVPLSPAARRLVAADPGLRPTILGGGDDYEILFAAPPEAAAALREEAASVAVPVTEIGTVTAGPGQVILVDENGAAIELDRPGWTHG